jgi:hypothetical protein
MHENIQYCSECGLLMEYFEEAYYTDLICDICRQKFLENIDNINIL